MLFRKALATDSEAIQSLYKALVNDAHVRVTPERIHRVTADPATLLLVGESMSVVVCTALIFFCSDVMYGDQPFAVVENVIVSSEMRGKGVGALLMKEIEKRCVARDCSKIMLLSSLSRVDAHRFFIRAGFSGDQKRGFVKDRSQMSA